MTLTHYLLPNVTLVPVTQTGIKIKPKIKKLLQVPIVLYQVTFHSNPKFQIFR